MSDKSVLFHCYQYLYFIMDAQVIIDKLIELYIKIDISLNVKNNKIKLRNHFKIKTPTKLTFISLLY